MSNSVLSSKDLRAAFQRSQVSSPPNSETQFRHARTGNHKLVSALVSVVATACIECTNVMERFVVTARNKNRYSITTF